MNWAPSWARLGAGSWGAGGACDRPRGRLGGPLPPVVPRAGPHVPGACRPGPGGDVQGSCELKLPQILEQRGVCMAPVTDADTAVRVTVENRIGALWVAEAPVVLHRPAKKRVGAGKRVDVPGEPLALRLVISWVLAEDGEILAEWFPVDQLTCPARPFDRRRWRDPMVCLALGHRELPQTAQEAARAQCRTVATAAAPGEAAQRVGWWWPVRRALLVVVPMRGAARDSARSGAGASGAGAAERAVRCSGVWSTPPRPCWPGWTSCSQVLDLMHPLRPGYHLWLKPDASYPPCSTPPETLNLPSLQSVISCAPAGGEVAGGPEAKRSE